jgi:hypothetical protein
VVSNSQLLSIGIDSVQTTKNSLFSGIVQQQSNPGTYSKASLSGTSVFYNQGYDVNSGSGETGIYLVSADGAGNLAVTGDQESGGASSPQAISTQYNIAANGRGTMNQSPVFYMTGPNTGLNLDTGSSVSTGGLEPQSPGPFSNSSVSGTFAGGSLPPVESYVSDSVSVIVVDGKGGVTISENKSSSNGLGQGLGGHSFYNTSPSGRGVSQDGTLIYFISPSKFLVMSPDLNPHLEVYVH